MSREGAVNAAIVALLLVVQLLPQEKSHRRPVTA